MKYETDDGYVELTPEMDDYVAYVKNGIVLNSAFHKKLDYMAQFWTTIIVDEVIEDIIELYSLYTEIEKDDEFWDMVYERQYGEKEED